MSKIKTFLEEFQDMYVTREVNLNAETLDLTSIELSFMEKYVDRLLKDVDSLSLLTHDAYREATEHYEKLISILEDKVDYISDTADVLNYVNSYFDMRTVRDLSTFDLKAIDLHSCLYDRNKSGITLKSLSNSFECSKELTSEGITFYNTNSGVHSGLHLSSKFLPLLPITQLVIRKSDGTTLDLGIGSLEETEVYLEHETLTSSQITITLGETNIAKDVLNTYLADLQLSLINYEYQTEGTVVVGHSKLTATDLFHIVSSSVLPTNTYGNIVLGVEVIDVNDNIISNITTTIPLSGSLICKRLDEINFNEVDELHTLYIKDRKSTANITQKYLEEQEFKNEKYVLYYPKELEENKLNKFITKLGNNSFRIKSKLVKYLTFTPTIELFTFNKSVSPVVQHITGVTKNETI